MNMLGRCSMWSKYGMSLTFGILLAWCCFSTLSPSASSSPLPALQPWPLARPDTKKCCQNICHNLFLAWSTFHASGNTVHSIPIRHGMRPAPKYSYTLSCLLLRHVTPVGFCIPRTDSVYLHLWKWPRIYESLLFTFSLPIFRQLMTPGRRWLYAASHSSAYPPRTWSAQAITQKPAKGSFG